MQARSRAHYERLLDAAETVFARVGYDAATTTLIASEAHSSIGSVYDLLGTKQDVARHLADRYLERLLCLFQELLRDDRVRRDMTLSCIIEALARFSNGHPALGPLLRAPPGSQHLEVLAFVLGPSLTEHIDRLLTVRASPVDPSRRHDVATMCAMLLRGMLLSKTEEPDAGGQQVAEQKLVVISYVAAALQRSRW